MKINKRKIGLGHPTYIVAEIGTNHNGNLELALEMVQAAHQAGVDAVKFQIVSADRSYSKKSDSYPIFRKIEMPCKSWEAIIQFAKEAKIDCFATFVNPYDLEEYSFHDWPAIKISSSNLTNFPLLKAIAKRNKPVIMSTGMSYLNEVKEAVHYLEENGQQQIALLHCTSLYPTLSKDVNLNALGTLSKNFPKYPVGFSDHTEGIYCAVAAVAMGASIIEKHFTLDRGLKGPDHHFSATPDIMKELVQAVREVEQALGFATKKPVCDEILFRKKWLRSLVALKNIQKGEILSQDNVGIKRSPQKGVEPKYFEDILGKKAKANLLKDDPIVFGIIG